jgi:DNA polymerase-3 subunit epsilon
LSRQRCVVVDVETAGLDPRRDALIAIGAVAVREGRIRIAETLEVVLRQATVSTHANILVHGIGGTAQREGLEPAEALLRFLEFAGKDPLIAFHVMFDETALRCALRRHLGVNLRARWLDLAYLLPALFPEHARSARMLDDWLRVFGIEVAQRHNASADALATAQLLLIALERARRHGTDDYRSLRRLEKAQRYTRYQSAATG